MNPHRFRILNAQAEQGDGLVVYWMDRDMRVHDNWSLLYAIECAQKKKVSIGVVYGLIPEYEHGGARQHDFKVRALKELEQELERLNISLYVFFAKRSWA